VITRPISAEDLTELKPPSRIVTPHSHTLLSDKELERTAQAIHAGDWAVQTERPISTLLGSCVAVCLFDAKLGMGGMNHFMLPRMKKTENSEVDVLLAGDYAMEVLVNAMLAKGAVKSRLVAKAFGGGNVIRAIKADIGDRNATFAREWLACEGIPLITSDFGGPWARKVICVPGSGEVLCRRVATDREAMSEIAEELIYEESLNVPKAGRIELF
jgi:chemotaxis protein CheD